MMNLSRYLILGTLVFVLNIHSAFAQTFGAPKDDGCNVGRFGHRTYSAKLHDVPAGTDAMKACKNSVLNISSKSMRPERCYNKGLFGIWGEFDVDDQSCELRAYWEKPKFDRCTSKDGAAILTYSARLAGVSSGRDPETACHGTKLEFQGSLGSNENRHHADIKGHPTRCENKGVFGQWGEFDQQVFGGKCYISEELGGGSYNLDHLIKRNNNKVYLNTDKETSGTLKANKSNEHIVDYADFIAVPKTAIKGSGHNAKTISNVPIEICIEHCEKTSELVCKSIDYNKATGECHLSKVGLDDIGQLKTHYPDGTWTHYARKKHLNASSQAFINTTDHNTYCDGLKFKVNRLVWDIASYVSRNPSRTPAIVNDLKPLLEKVQIDCSVPANKIEAIKAFREAPKPVKDFSNIIIDRVHRPALAPDLQPKAAQPSTAKKSQPVAAIRRKIKAPEPVSPRNGNSDSALTSEMLEYAKNRHLVSFKNVWTSDYIGNGKQEAVKQKLRLQHVEGEFFKIQVPNQLHLHIEFGWLDKGWVKPGWWSAHWRFEDVGGDAFRIQNRWKPDTYLHTENGKLEAGTIKPGWLSARWSFEVE